jgi:Flp pilus assembly pilin Flp
MNKVKKQVYLSRRQTAARFRRVIYRRGQTLVEYALILAMISIIAIAVLVNIGSSIKGVYSMIDSQILIEAQQSH